MKADNKTSKLKKIMISLTPIQFVIVAILLSCCMSVAYLKQEAVRTNSFNLASVNSTIVEDGVDPSAVSWGLDTKKVKLSLDTGSVDSYVRATFVVSVTDSNGSLIPMNLPAITEPDSSAQVTVGDFILHFNSAWSNDWIYKDGYFYYKNALTAGKSTPELLMGVTCTLPQADAATKYKDYTVKVDVLSDAIQAKGNTLEVVWGVTLPTTPTT